MSRIQHVTETTRSENVNAAIVLRTLADQLERGEVSVREMELSRPAIELDSFTRPWREFVPGDEVTLTVKYRVIR